MTEEELFGGRYRLDPAVVALQARPGRERRTCACRGIVEADPVDPLPGVAMHNAGPAHQAWRRAKGIEP